MTMPVEHDIDEFNDLMPHAVGVHAKMRRDNYGRPIPDGDGYLYQCLVQEQETSTRTAEATISSVSLTAYLNPWALNLATNERELRPVLESDIIGIVNPTGYESRTKVASIATYYDETGDPHNLIVRFE
jgi:hypothetical protein